MRVVEPRTVVGPVSDGGDAIHGIPDNEEVQESTDDIYSRLFYI